MTWTALHYVLRFTHYVDDNRTVVDHVNRWETEEWVRRKAVRLPGFTDVLAAAERIRSYVNRMPVMMRKTIGRMTGAEVFFKCEKTNDEHLA